MRDNKGKNVPTLVPERVAGYVREHLPALLRQMAAAEPMASVVPPVYHLAWVPPEPRPQLGPHEQGRLFAYLEAALAKELRAATVDLLMVSGDGTRQMWVQWGKPVAAERGATP